MDFANDSSDFIPSFPGDAPEFSHDEPMGEPVEVGGTGTILSPEPGADNSAKPTVDQIAAAAVLDAAFDSSAPSVAPSPAEPSAETAVGRLLSIDEQLIEQLGVGGVVDVQASGFRVKISGRAQFGHGRSIAEALCDLANPAKLA